MVVTERASDLSSLLSSKKIPLLTMIMSSRFHISKNDVEDKRVKKTFHSKSLVN